jgi:hypothetical protein
MGVDKISLSKTFLFTALMCLCVVVSWATRDVVFFRDYAIIWEGVGRMLSGYSPFSDIGMPIGPVVFYIPYIFADLFGFTWFNFQLSQLFQSLLLIIIGSCIVGRLNTSRKVYYWAVALYSLWFVCFLMHPWYNSTALLLLLLALYLSLLRHSGWLLLAGACTGLCVFCKQDYGFMALVACVVSITGRPLLSVPDYSALLRSPVLFVILKKLGLYCLGAILVASFFLSLYEDNYISYWFSLGSSSDVAINKISAIFTPKNGLFFLAITGLILGLKFRSFVLLVCSSMILVASVTKYTSGLYFTSFFFWLFLPPYLFEVKHSVIKRLEGPKKVFVFLIISMSIILAVKTPIVTAYYFWASTLTGKVEHYYFDASKVVLPVIDLGTCAPQLKNIYAPKAVCTSLYEIKKSVEGISNPSVLNISEFTPLTELVSGDYPSNHPLWYHLGISLHEREMDRILFEVDLGIYDLVAVQFVHTGPTFFHYDLLQLLRNSAQYRELNPMISPMNATDYCANPDICEGRIFLFIKEVQSSTI